MKKAIAIIVFGLLLSGNAYAEIKIIEEKDISSDTTVRTLCIDGYKFIITSSNTGESIVQAYYRGGGNKPQPEKC